MTGGRVGHSLQPIDPHPAALERVGDEPPVAVGADLANEVGRVVELASAGGLVGALAAGEALAGLGGDGLALQGEAGDLEEDVGVGGTDDNKWGHGGGGGDGVGAEGEGEVVRALAGRRQVVAGEGEGLGVELGGLH